ncbi:DUF853 family protein [Candidatus Thorarchaeota archaeon]|nr:MAG: DUF853 family protein [Candidatus Thorarchaeota archaeon]
MNVIDGINEHLLRVSIRYTRLLWFLSSFLAGVYLLLTYLLPTTNFGATFLIPARYFIEVFIFLTPVVGAIITASRHFVSLTPAILMTDEFLWYEVGDSLIGVSCLDISNTHSSVVNGENGTTVYDSSFLRALRSGLQKNTSLAFEAGINQNGPCLRFFISTYSKSREDAKSVLMRERMKLEAILLSSIKNIEFHPLSGSDLREAIGVSIFHEGSFSSVFDSKTNLLVIKGNPKVEATDTSSQIGVFLSTAMKKRISTRITTVLSVADGNSERKKMERSWDRIMEKEKRKEASLEDWATKKKLLSRYHETENKNGWFDCSTYVLVKSDNENEVVPNTESVSGMIQSIWGGDNTFSIKQKRLSRRIESRLITRRAIANTRLHANRVAAYVNTPVQSLPMMSKHTAPTFNIPSVQEIDNELTLGHAIYQDKEVSSVGLSAQMLREHLAVLGATGTGKTTLVKRLIAELSMRTDVPWWIFDVKGNEYSEFQKLGNVMVIRPGLDPTFSIPLVDSSHSSESVQGQSTFTLLRELIREEGSSDLSPAMEQLLFKAVSRLAHSKGEGMGADCLVDLVKKMSDDNRVGKMIRDALLNRLEILTREPLGAILSGGENQVNITDLMKRRVVFDLRYVARIGGMDAARLLYNLVAKRIFEAAMHRGISPNLNHVVVLEEASNLVPESYTRSSAADISTGESMVMLQRATGQGVIVVSTRPNISTNILANTATKVAFRLPYDSEVGGRFLSIDQNQERYLRILKRGRALISLPGLEAFEMSSDVFRWSDYSDFMSENKLIGKDETSVMSREGMDIESQMDTSGASVTGSTEGSSSKNFNRASQINSQLVAFMASEKFVVEREIREFISILSPQSTDCEIDEMIFSLISLGTIVREAIPFVDGGFVYTLPGKGEQAVSEVISTYLSDRLGLEKEAVQTDDFELIIDDIAIIIIGEHIRVSSLNDTENYIRLKMEKFGNGVEKLYVIVRGSVAAAKLREKLAQTEEFDSVSVLSAFPSSLDRMIAEIGGERYSVYDDATEKNASAKEEEVELIEAVHKRCNTATRAIQIRIWIGLIQDFIDISNGKSTWRSVLEFIETTVLQSKRARTVPLDSDEGRRAVTELLADEVLTAVRVAENVDFPGMGSGLWIVNSNVLMKLKDWVLEQLVTCLKREGHEIYRNHEYYDLCASDASYVVFPNQQQLSTLLHLQSEVICRKCKSKKVVCILSASEYIDEREDASENIIFRYLDSQQINLLP